VDGLSTFLQASQTANLSSLRRTTFASYMHNRTLHAHPRLPSARLGGGISLDALRSRKPQRTSLSVKEDESPSSRAQWLADSILYNQLVGRRPLILPGCIPLAVPKIRESRSPDKGGYTNTIWHTEYACPFLRRPGSPLIGAKKSEGPALHMNQTNPSPTEVAETTRLRYLPHCVSREGLGSVLDGPCIRVEYRTKRHRPAEPMLLKEEGFSDQDDDRFPGDS